MCSPGEAELPPDKMLKARCTWYIALTIFLGALMVKSSRWVTNYDAPGTSFFVFLLVVIIIVVVILLVVNIIVIIIVVIIVVKHLKMFPPAPALVAEQRPIRHCSHTCKFTLVILLGVIIDTISIVIDTIVVIVPPLT